MNAPWETGQHSEHLLRGIPLAFTQEDFLARNCNCPAWGKCGKDETTNGSVTCKFNAERAKSNFVKSDALVMQGNKTHPGIPPVPRANEWGSFPRSGRGRTLGIKSPFSTVSGLITVWVLHANIHTHSLPTAYFLFLLFVTLWMKCKNVSQIIFMRKDYFKDSTAANPGWIWTFTVIACSMDEKVPLGHA